MSFTVDPMIYIDDLVQDCSISIAIALLFFKRINDLKKKKKISIAMNAIALEILQS